MAQLLDHYVWFSLNLKNYNSSLFRSKFDSIKIESVLDHIRSYATAGVLSVRLDEK